MRNGRWKTNSAARLASMVEHLPVNVVWADRGLTIRYLNPACVQALKRLEHHLRVVTDEIVGRRLELLYDPSDPRVLSDPAAMPHRAEIAVGPETIHLVVTPLYDHRHAFLGPVVTWEVVTERLAAARRDKDLGDQLKQVVAMVMESAHAVGSAAEELTASSTQMAATAEETSSQASVVSAAAEQVSKNVQTVATGAEEMETSIREIAKNASAAARVATTAVRLAETTNTTVTKLGESSADIGKVIKVITSIAQQTNLLALNATIEAARAGEAGKGFAVVANEVKELAKETARATEDISRKIKAIQDDAKGAVDAIVEIGGIINEINDISNTIASAVEEQTATTNEIGRNVAQAAKGSSEIAQNITVVAEAVRSTTEGANEAQRAAAKLAHMATGLEQLVGCVKY